MANEVSSLIKNLPQDSLVLDAGCGGLSGENTTDYLIGYFGYERIRGVCKPSDELHEYRRKHPDLYVAERMFDIDTEIGHDLLVHDLNIESNMAMWENMHKATRFSHMLIYVMCTDAYGNEDTPAKIRAHWERVWGGKPDEQTIADHIPEDWELVDLKREERRPEIIWVLLKRRG